MDLARSAVQVVTRYLRSGVVVEGVGEWSAHEMHLVD